MAEWTVNKLCRNYRYYAYINLEMFEQKWEMYTWCGCFEIKVRTDTVQRSTRIREYQDLDRAVFWSEKVNCLSKVKPRLRASGCCWVDSFRDLNCTIDFYLLWEWRLLLLLLVRQSDFDVAMTTIERRYNHHYQQQQQQQNWRHALWRNSTVGREIDACIRSTQSCLSSLMPR